jgi:hypothetical protein
MSKSKILDVALVFCLWFFALIIGCTLSVMMAIAVDIVRQIADLDLRNLASFIMGMAWLALLKRLGEKK